MGEASSADRRRHHRVRVEGGAGGRATVLADVRVRTLSETAAEVEAGMPLAAGSSCDLRLDLPAGAVDVRARVVRVEEDAPGRWRVAVVFVAVETEDRTALRAFLSGGPPREGGGR